MPLHYRFFAYDEKFRGGLNLVVRDLENDGRAEIITVPKEGGGPQVRIFGWRNGSLVPTIDSFLAYDPTFRGGVSLAAGDLDGDGWVEIVTAPETGSQSHLRIWSSKKGVYRPSMPGLLAYSPNFRGGVTLANGDLDGDHKEDLVTGASQGSAHLRIFRYTKNRRVELSNPGFFAFSQSLRNGISVALVDTNEDGSAEIMTGRRKGEGLVHIYDSHGRSVFSFNAFPVERTDGINLAPAMLE